MHQERAPRLWVRASLLLVLLGLAGAAQAHHSWRKYHWARTSNPFTLKLGNNVSSGWTSYLSETSGDWNDSAVLSTTVVAGGTDGATCAPTEGRIEVCSSNYGGTGWLGIASISVSRFHIVQGTAKVNDFYFNQPQYNTPAWRRLVMCQEVAHDFGLDHQDERFDNANLGTCMDYTNDPDGGPGGASDSDPSNEHPNAHDFDQLERIYNHLDSTTTVGAAANAMPPAANSIDWNNPRSWGQLIRSTNGGRTQLFEQDFGGGKKVFTFVIWADTPDHGGGHHQ